MNQQDEKILQPVIASREVTTHILKAFGLHMSKKLGQNFLIDAGIVRGIVAAAEVKEGDRVLEIGPGIGTLTQGLAETGATVKAVELDKKLPANLPYYITTPILMALLERHLPITMLVTMVQKEVAERMIAQPGSRTYGALSVAVQYYTEPTIVLDVPPRSFIPAPEVDSVVIACRVRETPAVQVQDEKLFFRVVKAAFGQRRKTLANALRGGGFPKEQVRDAMEQAGIDPMRRGETLELTEFGRLADAFASLA